MKPATTSLWLLISSRSRRHHHPLSPSSIVMKMSAASPKRKRRKTNTNSNLTTKQQQQQQEEEKIPAAIDAELLAEKLSPPGRGLAVHYLNDEDDDDRSSWYILAEGWMPCPNAKAFQRQWDLHPEKRHRLKIFGRTVQEKRWSQSWGVPYRYSGATNPARPIAESTGGGMVKRLIDRSNDVLEALTPAGGDGERPYNACLQNWYEPEDTIGKHADDESMNQTGVPIFSLSWGGTRRFLFHSKATREKTEIFLKDGDLLVMGGTCQQTHHHEVPKRRKTMDPPTSRRINWTVRAFLPT